MALIGVAPPLVVLGWAWGHGSAAPWLPAAAAAAALGALGPLFWGRAAPDAGDPFPVPLRRVLAALAVAAALTAFLSVGAWRGDSLPAPPWRAVGLAAAAAGAVLIAALGRVEPAALPAIPAALGLLWTVGALGWRGGAAPQDLWLQVGAGAALGLQGWLLFAATLERWRKSADSAPRATRVVALAGAAGVALLAARGASQAAIAAACGCGAALLVAPALSAAGLRYRGPSGVPDWRHLLAAGWVCWSMLPPRCGSWS